MIDFEIYEEQPILKSGAYQGDSSSAKWQLHCKDRIHEGECPNDRKKVRGRVFVLCCASDLGIPSRPGKTVNVNS